MLTHSRPEPQQVFDHIKRVSSTFHLSSLASQIETCQQLLAGEELIEVAVLGRFKAGKSSFINSLTGVDVLPVGVVPVTSVITKLSCGDQQQVCIHYLDGTTGTVALGEVAEFVSEAKNPENRKGVAAVVITLPQLESYKGIVFVDTPGVGSVFQHNTTTSMNWLSRVGAALVAISVDPPLTEHELELIRELHRFTPKIVILLTKADLLNPEELEEVAAFVRSKIQERLGLELPVLPFSIKGGNAALREALDQRVLFPLSDYVTTHTEQILHYKLVSLLQQITEYLAIARKTAEASQQERQSLRTQILGEKQEARLLRDDIVLVRDKLRGETRPKILARFRERQPEVQRGLARDLEVHLQQWNLNLWQLTRRFEEWLHESLPSALTSISLSEQTFLLSILEAAQRAFSRGIEAFHNRLAERVERVWGIQLTRPAYKLGIAPPQSPQVFIGNVFDHHLDLLWFLIPMTVFGTPIRQHLRAKLPDALEKNLSRLATQWADQLNQAIDKMADESQAIITAEILTIEELLSQEHSELSDINYLVDVTRALQGQLLCQPGKETA